MVPLKYEVIMDEVNVYSNATDSMLFDIVFDAYNWACGENLKIELVDEANGLVYSEIKTRDQLRNIYLSSFRSIDDILVIRLDFWPDKYRGLLFNREDVRHYRIKISASVNGVDNWVLIYGDSEKDKRFLFFTR
jgi:hypothetical protein